MHLLRTTPGGFVDDSAGVVRIEQTPAQIVVLSSADTTLSLLAAASARLGPDFPSVRLANLAFLRQPAAIDFYEEDVLRHARVVIVDHLGGESYWPYGIERVTALAARERQWLVMFSGDLQEDPALSAKSTADAASCRLLWRYLREGGPRNAEAFLRASAWQGLGWGDASRIAAPVPLPTVSIHYPGKDLASVDDWRARWHPSAPVVVVLFYKAHLQAANTAVFDAIADALLAAGLNPLPVAVTSLKDALSLEGLTRLCRQERVALVMNTTAFAARSIDDEASVRRDPLATVHAWRNNASDGSDGRDAAEPWAGDAPVLQLVLSGANRDDWLGDDQGLRARDVAMHIALPEVDGRIITRAVSFKGLAYHCPLTQVDVVRYQPDAERIAFVVELARRWVRLRTVPNADKRIALIMANYPLNEGRIGNGVGLDTPASVIGILQRLRDEAYRVDDLPADGDALMARLVSGVTNDSASRASRPALQSYSLDDYTRRFATLPEAMQQRVNARWGLPQTDPTVRAGRFMIAGHRFGRVFVGIQPPRTRDAGDYASYHDADIVPPHAYLAFYWWLRDVLAADAVVHVGKHGNLEWLPGKSVALSAQCWPDVVLGPMPHLYPFIVNDPGEGSQAKRRAQAVIIDHLMPPLTRAETYGPLQDLERQVDEYYEALMVDPRRAALLRRSILAAIVKHRLHEELGLGVSDAASATSTTTGISTTSAPSGESPAAQNKNGGQAQPQTLQQAQTPQQAQTVAEDALLTRVDAYLCELKEAQIRDGLHTFGQSPQHVQRRDTLLALSRFPTGDGKQARAGFIGALALDLQLGGADYDPLTSDPALPWQGARPALLAERLDGSWRHHGDTRERLELLALALLDGTVDIDSADALQGETLPLTRQVLGRIATQLAPRLDACGPQELHQLMRGLAGRFVPPGPSGAPSRGRPDVLPTGRNFYSVDTRAIPTQSAWALGLKSANQLVERHLQDHGDFPRAVGLSVWGTATMRTGGDDIAQAFALLGVRPKWSAGSHRVSDFEILPITIFNRPRIDVTLRVSGFFRDAFANVMHLFDAAVQAIAELDEPEEENPVRARVIRERDEWIGRGLDAEAARERAGWRVFGARPGAYGAGLQSMIDASQWQDDADLASAYQSWGAHAYAKNREGTAAAEAFGTRLASIDVVVQNQDNREHDVLDSNDYYQFQGGMTAAVRHLSGQQPAVYLADHSQVDVPRVRTLHEEIARVIRSRVVNPKWIDGVKRHGYKGAAELADTVDCLFGYDATARVVSDHQYALLTDAYLNDPATRDFLERYNVQALKSICERLLEAMQRGLWQAPGDYRRQVEDHLLSAEAHLEQNA